MDSTSTKPPFFRRLRWAQAGAFCAAAALSGLTTGCENPNPLAPVDPIGEYPVWGTDFGKDKIENAEDSLVNQGVGAAAVAASDGGPAAAAGAGTETTATMVEGRTVFLNNCARCHGPQGKGMNVAMIGQTANLQSKEIMGRSDTDLMNVIARGKGKMPAFGSQLSAKQMSAVLSWLRAGTPTPK